MLRDSYHGLGIYSIFAGRASGIIVDTPSSFAAGPSGGSDHHRQTLIKACVDAFRSTPSTPPPFLIRCANSSTSKRHPRRGPRKAQRRNATHIRKTHHNTQDSQIRWRTQPCTLFPISSLLISCPYKVVELDSQYRARVRNYQMHSYFYGERFTPPPGMPGLLSGPASSAYLVGGEQVTDFTLAPLSSVVPFGDLAIWRIGEGASSPFLPTNSAGC